MKSAEEFNKMFFESLNKSSDRVFFYYAYIKENKSHWTDKAVEYFGLPGNELAPTTVWDDKIHPNDLDAYLKNFEDMINHVTPYHDVEYRIKNAAGEYVWVNCRGYMHYDENNEPYFFAGYVTNMGTVNKIDFVTGLWTNYGFRAEMTRRLDKHIPGAAMQINIRNFKRINSKYGYEFGDKVMYTLGQKINFTRGKYDTYNLDGAQFAVIIEGGEQEVFDFHRRLKDRISEIMIDGINLYIDFSASATLFPRDGQFIDQIQTNLYYALSVAKQSLTEDVVFYTSDILEMRNKHIRLTDCIRHSVENYFEGFRLVFQPIIDRETGKIHSAEVLLRWSSPEFTNIGPADFVPILEETHAIVPVGKWIIDKAFSLVSKWNSMENTNLLEHINVNFSYIQFKDKSLKDYVIERLDHYRLPHDTLIAELTESCRVEYTDKLAELLQEYRDAGVLIALDDFGTGYASLSVLKDIPADIVKLDHTMTKTIADREKDRNLVEFIIEYCKKMNIDVCTEGIENDAIREVVRSAGTRYLQGYLYDKPLEEKEFFDKYIKIH